MRGMERRKLSTSLRVCRTQRCESVRLRNSESAPTLGEMDISLSLSTTMSRRPMPNACQHRQAGAEHGLGHGLFIKGPQIFQRAAAPHKHNNLRPALGIGFFHGAHNAGRGLRPLHERRKKANARTAAPPGRKLQKIMNGRAGGRGDQGHPLRVVRQGAFAPGAKIAQRRQLAFGGLKGLGQQAFARRLHQFDNKLVLPARRIQGYAPGTEHIHAAECPAPRRI